MMHVQRLSRPGLGLDLPGIRQFLRYESDHEDSGIAAMAEAVAREIEDLAELALIDQLVRVTWRDWCVTGPVRLPIGPVMAEDPQLTVTADGAPVQAELLGGIRPVLVPGADLLTSARHSRVVVEYLAGFGADADALPPDLVHAIRDQVAVAFVMRGGHAPEARHGTPTGIAAMAYSAQRALARYRGVRA